MGDFENKRSSFNLLGINFLNAWLWNVYLSWKCVLAGSSCEAVSRGAAGEYSCTAVQWRSSWPVSRGAALVGCTQLPHTSFVPHNCAKAEDYCKSAPTRNIQEKLCDNYQKKVLTVNYCGQCQCFRRDKMSDLAWAVKNGDMEQVKEMVETKVREATCTSCQTRYQKEVSHFATTD